MLSLRNTKHHLEAPSLIKMKEVTNQVLIEPIVKLNEVLHSQVKV